MARFSISKREWTKVCRHMDTLNTEMGIIKTDMAVVKERINWVKWFMVVNIVAWAGALIKFLIGV